MEITNSAQHTIERHKDTSIYIITTIGHPTMDAMKQQFDDIDKIASQHPKGIYLILDVRQVKWNIFDLIGFTKLTSQNLEGSPNDPRIKHDIFVIESKFFTSVRDALTKVTGNTRWIPVVYTVEEAIDYMEEYIALYVTE